MLTHLYLTLGCSCSTPVFTVYLQFTYVHRLALKSVTLHIYIPGILQSVNICTVCTRCTRIDSGSCSQHAVRTVRHSSEAVSLPYSGKISRDLKFAIVMILLNLGNVFP